MDTDEQAARERVADLLAWAQRDLGLGDSAFRGATDDQLARLVHAYGVDALPAAYDEFLRRMGQSGVGSAVFELFPGDDVAVESMLPDADWPGGPGLVATWVPDHPDLATLPGGPVAVWARRDTDIACIGAAGPADPPVMVVARGRRMRDGVPSFTVWLEHAVHRAVKRRYPLAAAVFEA